MSFFDTAADEAWAEIESAETADEGQAPESTPTAAEPTTPAPEVTPTAAETPPTTPPEAEEPWWQAHLADEVEYGGQKLVLEEALKGGLRQADYTRKTQELSQRGQYADWGERVYSDLQRDPVGTLKALAQELKLIPAEADDYNPQEPPDPALVELHQLRSELQTIQQEARIERTRREVEAAKARFPDFGDEVLALVVAQGERGNLISIEDGYYLWKGQKSIEEARAAEAARARAEAEAATIAAARQAQVASGHSAAAGTSDIADYSDVDPDELFDRIAADVFGPED